MVCPKVPMQTRNPRSRLCCPLSRVCRGWRGYFALHGKLVRCHRVGCPNRSTPARLTFWFLANLAIVKGFNGAHHMAPRGTVGRHTWPNDRAAHQKSNSREGRHKSRENRGLLRTNERKFPLTFRPHSVKSVRPRSLTPLSSVERVTSRRSQIRIALGPECPAQRGTALARTASCAAWRY